jgi:hypothetical protein
MNPNSLLSSVQPRVLDPPTLPPQLHPAAFVTLPLTNPEATESLTQQARQFHDVLYGNAPTKITEETTRFVLNNPNGVTRDGLYEHLTEYLMELL